MQIEYINVAMAEHAVNGRGQSHATRLKIAPIISSKLVKLSNSNVVR